MRVLLLSLLAIPAIVQAGARPVPVRITVPYVAASCPEPGIQHVAGRSPRAGVQKLGDLPPADHYLAVDRRVGGCSRPVIVASDIGMKKR